MRRMFLILIICLSLSSSFSFAEDEIDFSIDEEIQKNFTLKSIESEEELPPLPASYYERDLEKSEPTPVKVQKQETQPVVQTSVAKTPVAPQPQKQVPTQKVTLNHFKIYSGTKIMMKNDKAFSSSTPQGAVLTFKTVYTQRFGQTTLPAGTTFKAVIESSHKPQISGNGGLIKMHIYEVVINGKSYPVKANTTLANNKKVFFNNIKGERKYLKNLSKPIKPATRFMGKMWDKTWQYSSDGGVKLILTPFTFVSGITAVGGAVVVSPVVSLFNKGGNVYFNAGTVFNFKVVEDTSF